MSDPVKEAADAARALLAEQARKNREARAPVEAQPEAAEKAAETTAPTALSTQSRRTEQAPAAGDKDAIIVSLRNELQQQKVEAGRVKALSDEIKTLKQENAELKKLVDAKKLEDESLLSHVEPSRRASVDEDILKSAEDIALATERRIMAALDARLAPIQGAVASERETRAKTDEAAFDAQIDKAHPGFAKATSEGGNLCEKWEAFLCETDHLTGEPNTNVLTKAYQAKRFAGVDQIICNFKDKAGITRRATLEGAAHPSSSAPGGSAPVGTKDTKRYTQQEIQDGLDQSRKDLAAKRITLAQRNEILKKFQLAISERRVIREPVPNVG